jgi:tetratricopeptide (TPR) repeat protein
MNPQDIDQHKDSLPSRCMLSTIINMNNEGVAHLKYGDYKTAITTFLSALKSCKQVASQDDGGAADTPSLDEYMASSNSSNEDENKDGDNQVIYRHAIVVPETRRDDRIISKAGQKNTATAALMSTIIIFNAAIAHHLMALKVMIRQEKRALKILRKAANLYEIGLTLAQEQGETTCYSGPGSLLFVLASMNNMALVYKAMDANDVANDCLEQLLATIMFVIDCGGSVKFDGFLANTSCLIFSASPGAAAA